MRLHLIFLCLLPNLALAELPAEHRRAVEMTRIIAEGSVARALNEAPIIRIESQDNDVYQVDSESCTVMVKIVDTLTPTPRPGPRQFNVIVTRVSCR
jgi:hypothetical protein